MANLKASTKYYGQITINTKPLFKPSYSSEQSENHGNLTCIND